MQSSTIKDVDVGAGSKEVDRFKELRHKIASLEPREKHFKDNKYKKERKLPEIILKEGDIIYFKAGRWSSQAGILSGAILDIEPHERRCYVLVLQSTHPKLDENMGHIRSVALSSEQVKWYISTDFKQIEMTEKDFLKTMEVRNRGEK